MSQNATTETARDDVPHSKPIPISTDHLRHRSASLSSDSSSSPPLVTPPKSFPSSQFPISPSSPMFYYLSQSPTKAPPTFPFRGFPPPPVPEDEHADDVKPPAHVRRASTIGRFQAPPPAPEPHHERGVNVLRRLSLSRPRPSPADLSPPGNPGPPNTAAPTSPFTNDIPLSRKTRRATTFSDHVRPRRAPSPMGERILKGHFDGFN